MLRRSLWVLLAALLLAPLAAAQNTTTVNGTIVDPNGYPYSNATIQAQLIPSGVTPTVPPPCNGQNSTPCAVSAFSQANANAAGTFSMNLASNAVLSPGGTQWQFTVNELGILPPLGNGSQQFTATLTISGASQNISASLNALAPALSRGATSVSTGSLAIQPTTDAAGIFTVKNAAGTSTIITVSTLSGGNALQVTGSGFGIVTNTEEVSGSLQDFGSFLVGNTLLFNATAPTISSGFGTSPSIVSNNGPAAFQINVGTGGTATSGVIGLPGASHGWACTASDVTTNSATVFLTRQTASTTNTATLTNLNTSGAAAAWAASDLLNVSCLGF